MFCTYKQMTFLSTIHLTCNLTLRAIWVRCVYLERSQFMIKQHSSFFLSLSFFFLSFFLSLSLTIPLPLAHVQFWQTSNESAVEWRDRERNNSFDFSVGQCDQNRPNFANWANFCKSLGNI